MIKENNNSRPKFEGLFFGLFFVFVLILGTIGTVYIINNYKVKKHYYLIGYAYQMQDESIGQGCKTFEVDKLPSFISLADTIRNANLFKTVVILSFSEFKDVNEYSNFCEGVASKNNWQETRAVNENYLKQMKENDFKSVKAIKVGTTDTQMLYYKTINKHMVDSSLQVLRYFDSLFQEAEKKFIKLNKI